MASSSQFFFSILRISIIQLLRSVGFDRCSNRVIDILTDIFIRHLELVSTECRKLAYNSGRLDFEIQDVAQTMVNLRVIRPARMIDPYDISAENYLGMKNFVRWLKSEKFAKMRKTAMPSRETVQLNLLDVQNDGENGNANSANNGGGAGGDSNGVTDNNLEYNMKSRGSGGNSNGAGIVGINGEQTNDLGAVLRQNREQLNWLKYLLKTQSKIDYDEKIRLTILNAEENDEEVVSAGADGNSNNNNNNDYLIVGPTPKHLVDYLPCKRKLLQEMNE